MPTDAEFNKMQAEKHALEGIVIDLRSQLAGMNAEISRAKDLEAQVSGLSNELIAAKHDLHRAHADVTVHKAAISDLNGHITEHKKTISDLKSKSAWAT